MTHQQTAEPARLHLPEIAQAVDRRGAPTPTSAHPFLQLRRMLGNNAAGRSVQAKLRVSHPGDAAEQEADRVADQVMGMPEPEAGKEAVASEQPRPRVQRMCRECEEEKTLPAKAEPSAAGAVVPSAGEQIDAVLGGGQPLPASVRAFFEPRFGHDFGQVRVHTDAPATKSALEVGALAYTVGPEIVFGAGHYAPESATGQRLLAHELTHVVQQGGGSGASRAVASPISSLAAEAVAQRAISPELDKIESYLSYGLFDWAITDSEAIRALELLKTLPKYQQAVFAADPTYLPRLRDNLPASRLPELDEIEKGVAGIRPPTPVVEDIQSKLSYGLFDWAVTDEEAIAVLEKLKKLSGTELAVVLGAIDYGRLMDNLPDSRKQELIDLLAQGLGTGGARETEEKTHPGTLLNSVTFKSDHGVLRDNRSDWSSSGPFYGQPEWFVDADGKTVSKPISQSKNTSVEVDVRVNVQPLMAPPAPISLRGESDVPFLQFAFSGTMQGGMNQVISMTSVGTLPDEVTAIPAKPVRWIMKWRDWEREISRTSHSIFVTMNAPRNPGEVTYKRMAKAIEIISPLGTLVPHEVVRGIMRHWNVYNLRKIYANAWELADNIAEGAQCIDIVRFVMGLIETVGCPGAADAVVIWAHPSDPHVPAEQIYSGPVGLHTVGPHPAHPGWLATLLDGDWHSNAFEAALKFDHGGTLAYYPGGVDAVLATALQVLHVFKCLAWVRPSGGLGCRIMEVPADYPLGPCPVGSEHECFVRS